MSPRTLASTLANRTAAMRGVYAALSRRGARDGASVWFSLTRLSQDGTHAYGYYCTDGKGAPIPGTPLVKLRLNAARTAPEGFRPRPGRNAS